MHHKWKNMKKGALVESLCNIKLSVAHSNRTHLCTLIILIKQSHKAQPNYLYQKVISYSVVFCVNLRTITNQILIKRETVSTVQKIRLQSLPTIIKMHKLNHRTIRSVFCFLKQVFIQFKNFLCKCSRGCYKLQGQL